jgi:hypothetical protein
MIRWFRGIYTCWCVRMVRIIENMSGNNDEEDPHGDTENVRFQPSNPPSGANSFVEKGEEDDSSQNRVTPQPGRSGNGETWGAQKSFNNPQGGNEINSRSPFVPARRGISLNARMSHGDSSNGDDYRGNRAFGDRNSEDEKVSKLDWFIDFVKTYFPYVLYGLGLIVIILYGIILAGSATNTPGMGNLYLVRVHNKNEAVARSVANITEPTYLAGDVSVGIGYFGIRPLSFLSNELIN